MKVKEVAITLDLRLQTALVVQIPHPAQAKVNSPFTPKA